MLGWKQKFQRKKGFTILTSVWFSPFWQYSCKPYSGKQQAEIMYIKDSKCNTRELLQKMSMFVQLFVRAKHDNDFFHVNYFTCSSAYLWIRSVLFMSLSKEWVLIGYWQRSHHEIFSILCHYSGYYLSSFYCRLFQEEMPHWITSSSTMVSRVMDLWNALNDVQTILHFSYNFNWKQWSPVIGHFV